MSKKKKTMINAVGIIVFAILFLADRISKIIAVHTLKDQPAVWIVNRVFCLQYLENRGAAFGILQGKRFVFLIITVIILLIVIYVYERAPLKKRFLPLRIILLLIASGAVGNMVDRTAQGYVVDFFYFSLIHFPIFNVADIYVTIGAILLIIFILFFYKDTDLKALADSLKGKK